MVMVVKTCGNSATGLSLKLHMFFFKKRGVFPSDILKEKTLLVWGQLDCMFNVFELIPKKTHSLNTLNIFLLKY